MEETQDGSYILDANDLCMIEHVAALAQAGVTSLKIEGRAKAAFYVAGTVNAYRMAVDGYAASGCSPEYHPPEWVREETEKVSHRPYGTGFYFGIPGQNVRAGGYVRPYEVAGGVGGMAGRPPAGFSEEPFFPRGCFGDLGAGKEAAVPAGILSVVGERRGTGNR